jgi:hypothetical protein
MVPLRVGREKKERNYFTVFPGSDRGMSKMEPTGIEPVTSIPQQISAQDVAATPAKPLAHSLARETQKSPEIDPSTRPLADALDPNLVRLIEAWPRLSATVKRMILAALESSTAEAVGLVRER